MSTYSPVNFADYKIIKTTRGTELLFDGFTHKKLADYRSNHGETSYWRCGFYWKSLCEIRLKLNHKGLFVKGRHSHGPSHGPTTRYSVPLSRKPQAYTSTSRVEYPSDSSDSSDSFDFTVNSRADTVPNARPSTTRYSVPLCKKPQASTSTSRVEYPSDSSDPFDSTVNSQAPTVPNSRPSTTPTTKVTQSQAATVPTTSGLTPPNTIPSTLPLKKEYIEKQWRATTNDEDFCEIVELSDSESNASSDVSDDLNEDTSDTRIKSDRQKDEEKRKNDSGIASMNNGDEVSGGKGSEEHNINLNVPSTPLANHEMQPYDHVEDQSANKTVQFIDSQKTEDSRKIMPAPNSDVEDDSEVGPSHHNVPKISPARILLPPDDKGATLNIDSFPNVSINLKRLPKKVKTSHDCKLNDYEFEIKRLQQQLELAGKEKESNNEQLDDLRKQLNFKNKKEKINAIVMEDLQSNTIKLEAQNIILRKSNDELNKRLLELMEEKINLEKKMEKIKLVEWAKRLTEEIKIERDKHEKEMETKMEEIASLKKQLEEKDIKMAEIPSLNSKLKENERKVEALKESLNTVSSKYQNIKEKLTSISKEIDDKEEDFMEDSRSTDNIN